MFLTTHQCEICKKFAEHGFGTPNEDICFECYDRIELLKKDLKYIERLSSQSNNPSLKSFS